MALALFMRGEPLVSKLAKISRFGVLPGAMVAALLYSPQQDPNKKVVQNKWIVSSSRKHYMLLVK